MPEESTDPDSCGNLDCQKCALLGIKRRFTTDDERISHDMLHKRHADVLLRNNANEREEKRVEDESDVRNVWKQNANGGHNKSENGECQPRESNAPNSKRLRTNGCTDIESQECVPMRKQQSASYRINRYLKTTETVLQYFDDSMRQFLMKAAERNVRRDQYRRLFCRICGLVIQQTDRCILSWNEIFDHARSHTGKKYFLCSLCAHECATKLQIDNHRYYLHELYKQPNHETIERAIDQEELQELCQVMVRCLTENPTSNSVTGINGDETTEETEVIADKSSASRDQQSGSRSSGSDNDGDRPLYDVEFQNVIYSSGVTLNHFDGSTQNYLTKTVGPLLQQACYRFTCRLCKRSFGVRKNNGVLWSKIFDHARLHTGKNYFSCSVCAYKSVTKAQFFTHQCRDQEKCQSAKRRATERRLQPEELQELCEIMILSLCEALPLHFTVRTSENRGTGAAKTASGRQCKRRTKSEASTSNASNAENASSSDKDSAESTSWKTSRTMRARRSLCQSLFAENAVDDRLSCLLCSGTYVKVHCSLDGSYIHALRHCKLPLFSCIVCPTHTTHDYMSMHEHIRWKHQKIRWNSYNDRSNEFHDEIVAQILQCFDPSRAQS